MLVVHRDRGWERSKPVRPRRSGRHTADLQLSLDLHESLIARSAYEFALPTTAWAALARYGDVQDVHPAITKSHAISLPEVAVGSERFCHILSGNRVEEIEERIEQIDPGVYNVIDYMLKPAMMTGLFRGTMKKNASGAVLSYKHFIETGEGSVPIDELRERYAAR